jgi:alkanesulfonate monooxygenase SsuD/methylene tetrahydromethanopterin reductase-like flavin-dependent oxidoreductase (luciferase family)
MPQLAYLAARTSTIRLGAGTIIAPFWNPIRVAGECALLDVISGGRAEVGLARGAYQFEFDRMADGIPASSGGNHLRELVPAVRALWRGDYAHDGEIWKFPTSTSVPKPIQQPMPMWIAARDPASHDFAVKNGCNVMVTPLMKGDEEVVDLRDKFETALANNPGVPRPELMVLRHTHVHPADEPDGWVPAAQAISRFYRTFDAWFGNKTTPVDGFLDPSPESKFAGRPEFELDSLHKTAMIGTPDEVIERIRHYQDLGVDEYSFWCDNSLPHEEKKKSLQLFIDEVVPAFR